MNDKGQAVTEYVLIMVFFVGAFLALRSQPTFMAAFRTLLGGIGSLASSYDFVLSLPIP